MSPHRSLALAGILSAVTAVGMAIAPAASATSASAYTGTSSKGGYGYGWWDNDASFEKTLGACDYGSADGLRAVAILKLNGGAPIEVHAASGSGSCNSAPIYGAETGDSFSFKVCLRDGASGYDRLCSSTRTGYVS
ncbi:hypothetical protein [Streptomyces eurythermus]|uniref:hypothetical protein n=1 Tax=Streptomyces eurythermus TaxID=42237 RepID=UPI0036FB2AC3